MGRFQAITKSLATTVAKELNPAQAKCLMISATCLTGLMCVGNVGFATGCAYSALVGAYADIKAIAISAAVDNCMWGAGLTVCLTPAYAWLWYQNEKRVHPDMPKVEVVTPQFSHERVIAAMKMDRS